MLATAKIHILKQFTTPNEDKTSHDYCACYCKDTHFEAIHNGNRIGSIVPLIVLATAKIHILKQFTTLRRGTICVQALCLLLQRYTFWSNSQPLYPLLALLLHCACYCKDTHFEAIHNFITAFSLLRILCLLLQRYTFWSNSQQPCQNRQRQHHCACYCKDTHFEAIHNRIFQRRNIIILCLLLQRYTFWSNSQLSLICVVLDSIVLATAKIHILKQFTTRAGIGSGFSELCLLLQRYTFWSNSQQRWYYLRTGVIVLATAKIHILKQFTT